LVIHGLNLKGGYSHVKSTDEETTKEKFHLDARQIQKKLQKDGFELIISTLIKTSTI